MGLEFHSHAKIGYEFVIKLVAINFCSTDKALDTIIRSP
jgi:hypothetical protein